MPDRPMINRLSGAFFFGTINHLSVQISNRRIMATLPNAEIAMTVLFNRLREFLNQINVEPNQTLFHWHFTEPLLKMVMIIPYGPAHYRTEINIPTIFRNIQNMDLLLTAYAKVLYSAMTDLVVASYTENELDGFYDSHQQGWVVPNIDGCRQELAPFWDEVTRVINPNTETEFFCPEHCDILIKLHEPPEFTLSDRAAMDTGFSTDNIQRALAFSTSTQTWGELTSVPPLIMETGTLEAQRTIFTGGRFFDTIIQHLSRLNADNLRNDGMHFGYFLQGTPSLMEQLGLQQFWVEARRQTIQAYELIFRHDPLTGTVYFRLVIGSTFPIGAEVEIHNAFRFDNRIDMVLMLYLDILIDAANEYNRRYPENDLTERTLVTTSDGYTELVSIFNLDISREVRVWNEAGPRLVGRDNTLMPPTLEVREVRDETVAGDTILVNGEPRIVLSTNAGIVTAPAGETPMPSTTIEEISTDDFFDFPEGFQVEPSSPPLPAPTDWLDPVLTPHMSEAQRNRLKDARRRIRLETQDLNEEAYRRQNQIRAQVPRLEDVLFYDPNTKAPDKTRMYGKIIFYDRFLGDFRQFNLLNKTFSDIDYSIVYPLADYKKLMARKGIAMITPSEYRKVNKHLTRAYYQQWYNEMLKDLEIKERKDIPYPVTVPRPRENDRRYRQRCFALNLVPKYHRSRIYSETAAAISFKKLTSPDWARLGFKITYDEPNRQMTLERSFEGMQLEGRYRIGVPFALKLTFEQTHAGRWQQYNNMAKRLDNLAGYFHPHVSGTGNQWGAYCVGQFGSEYLECLKEEDADAMLSALTRSMNDFTPEDSYAKICDMQWPTIWDEVDKRWISVDELSARLDDRKRDEEADEDW